MRIVDILGPLEAERMNILFSTENLKVRNLSIAFFNFKLPLEPTHSRTSVRCLQIKSGNGNVEKIIVGLLWHACYGKKFKTYHWFVLFNVLIRTMNKDKCSEAILSTLVILTANAAASRWNSNFKPLKSIFRHHYGEETHQGELDRLLNDLPYRLPKKAPIIDDLLLISESQILLQKPKELARIGVGYKDKGSLSQKVKPELQTPSFQPEKEDCFDVLLRQVQAKYNKLL